eukprot:7378076-Prymnesium_polylepis.1
MDSYGCPGGPLRLWPGGVAQARSIGDSDIGDFNDARPHVCSYSFPKDGQGDVIICSDGVWDALLHQDVAALCRKSAGCTAAVTAGLVVKRSLEQRHAFDNSVRTCPASSSARRRVRHRSCVPLTRASAHHSFAPGAQEMRIPRDDTSCIVFRIGEPEDASD